METDKNPNTNLAIDRDGEIRDLVAALFLDASSGKPNPAEMLKAQMALDAMKENMSVTEKDRVDQLFAGHISNGVKGVAPKTEDNSKALSYLKKELTADAIFSGLSAGVGLFQVIDATIKKGNLKPPRIPEKLTASKELQSQLTKAIYRSEQGINPKLKSYYESRVAEANEIDNFRAKATGNIGQFVGNIQGNAIQRSKAMQEFALKNEDEQRANRREVRALIGDELNEKQVLQNDEYRRFGIEESRYNRSLQNLDAQQGNGLDNLFGGAQSATSSLNRLSMLNEENSPAVADDPLTPPTLTKPERNIPSIDYKQAELGEDGIIRRPGFESGAKSMGIINRFNAEDMGVLMSDSSEGKTPERIKSMRDFYGKNIMGEGYQDEIDWDAPFGSTDKFMLEEIEKQTQHFSPFGSSLTGSRLRL